MIASQTTLAIGSILLTGAIMLSACRFSARSPQSTVSPSSPQSSVSPTAPGYQSHTVTNAQDGLSYTVTYPANWHPSGIAYANSFEIRNYPPDSPQTTPARNRANVLATDTADDTPEAAARFLDDRLRAPNMLPANQRSLTINGYRAVKVYTTRPAAEA